MIILQHTEMQDHDTKDYIKCYKVNHVRTMSAALNK